MDRAAQAKGARGQRRWSPRFVLRGGATRELAGVQPKRDPEAVLTRVWLKSDVRDITNPNTGSRRAETADHGKAAQQHTGE